MLANKLSVWKEQTILVLSKLDILEEMNFLWYFEEKEKLMANEKGLTIA